MKFHLTSATLASFGLMCASLTGLAPLKLSANFSPNFPDFTEAAIAQDAAPTVTTTSDSKAIELAKYLTKKGAKLYTAYWCPHCHNQKQRFGKEAVRQLQVVECDPRGVNPQTELCRSKKVRAYPTWEIDGKLYSGNKSLENLANLSKYRGSL
ncbi:hypothetical protein H6F42_11510 [Pseudanabaena sp. FACHB-1998]|uniref:hypothetical protein n=1 Tax=Pseudanabaena sp. FACHB-1998 TaxID=2692858 RepID=UPI001681129F|nr:hypothetical protein [Pseudanabaena sp. FACHB-1998]MBD2177540.1 hypothetical protein [Pseudanabaena sp. FACHB-1998]